MFRRDLLHLFIFGKRVFKFYCSVFIIQGNRRALQY